jgi:hypothetical protein
MNNIDDFDYTQILKDNDNSGLFFKYICIAIILSIWIIYYYKDIFVIFICSLIMFGVYVIPWLFALSPVWCVIWLYI